MDPALHQQNTTCYLGMIFKGTSPVGSGFLFMREQRIYLLTAAHVLFDKDTIWSDDQTKRKPLENLEFYLNRDGGAC